LLTEYHNMLGVLDLLGTRERIVWQTPMWRCCGSRCAPQ
jgi:hypothetical protein